MQISFAGLLALIFITLKLTGVIAWPWLWVLAPIWIGFAVWLTIVVVFGGFAVIAALIARS